jgi:hypothetical protein
VISAGADDLWFETTRGSDELDLTLRKPRCVMTFSYQQSRETIKTPVPDFYISVPCFVFSPAQIPVSRVA